MGYDCRESTPTLRESLFRGLIDAGANVYDIGLSTTPMVYYATASRGFDASVQITASHNPSDYNGFKISRTGALPVGYDTGLAQLEGLLERASVQPVAFKGSLEKVPGVLNDYIGFLTGFKENFSNLEYAVDCSNGMAALLARRVFGPNVDYMYDELDGSFPNHPPNPLELENTRALSQKVTEGSLDAGVIFDGDGDRVMFVDEQGHFVRPDIITALLGMHFLSEDTGWVLHDIRTSRGVIEYIEMLGGRPFMWKVGHSHAKLKMRELNAIYGGELAGHYYFRDFFNCDSGMLAAILVLNILSREKQKGVSFSNLVDSVSAYANSGELNFRIDDKKLAMNRIVEYFAGREEPSAVYDFDGYRVEFPSWWFNIRPSNTEPYLRLVAEAENMDILNEKLAGIRRIIAELGGRE